VFADTPQHLAAEVVTRLKERGVWCSAMGERRIRLVTHLDVSNAAVDQACTVLKTIF
jgi:threonine aldolase